MRLRIRAALAILGLVPASTIPVPQLLASATARAPKTPPKTAGVSLGDRLKSLLMPDERVRPLASKPGHQTARISVNSSLPGSLTGTATTNAWTYQYLYMNYNFTDVDLNLLPGGENVAYGYWLCHSTYCGPYARTYSLANLGDCVPPGSEYKFVAWTVGSSSGESNTAVAAGTYFGPRKDISITVETYRGPKSDTKVRAFDAKPEC